MKAGGGMGGGKLEDQYAPRKVEWNASLPAVIGVGGGGELGKQLRKVSIILIKRKPASL